MHNSPSNYSKEEFKETFEALYEESIKMIKRKMELKKTIKNATMEKEALGQKVTSMENKEVLL